MLKSWSRIKAIKHGVVVNLPRILFSCIVIFSLSACTSKQMLAAGCDFATGASEQHTNHKARAASNDHKYDSDSYLMGGLFTLISGAINRSLSSDKKSRACS